MVLNALFVFRLNCSFGPLFLLFCRFGPPILKYDSFGPLIIIVNYKLMMCYVLNDVVI
jgi:hypothetical protein